MQLERRQFIHYGISALAVAAAHPLRGAAARGKSRPIGFSLYGMKSLPVAEAINHCKRIGYDNIELCLMPGFPTELPKFTPPARREARARLQSTGLELSSLLVHINLTSPDQTPSLEIIKGAAEVARDLDDHRPPLIESVTGGKADDWEATKEKVAANMRRWAETAAAGGVKIARMVGSISKDIVPGAKPAKYLLVGEGTVDYVKYFRLLRELRYTGPLLVEVSAQIHRLPDYQPIPTAEKCYAFLARALKASLV